MAIGGAVHSRRFGGSILDIAIAPLLALVVVVLAEWSEFVDQPSPFKYAPYFMLVWIVIGIAVRLATRSRVAAAEEASDPVAMADADAPVVPATV